MNFGIIIQARLGSTRMPNKIFYEVVDNKNILDIIHEKLTPLNISMIFAIPDSAANDELETYLLNKNYLVERGSENNVLQRMLNTAKKHDIDFIVRVCSDNLFLQSDFVKDLVLNTNIEDDYVSYYFNDDTPTILSHQGFYAEVVKTKTLEKVLSITNDTLYLEHVTNYIHQHPNQFKVKKLSLPLLLNNNQNNLRLTIDTPEDFEIAKTIFKNVAHKENVKNIIEEVAKHKDFQKSMKERINKYIK